MSRISRRTSDIGVGLTGAGFMGRALLHQCVVTSGINCVVLANRDVGQAVAVAEAEGLRYCLVDDAQGLARAIEAGRLAITTHAALLAGCERVDVVLEATRAIGPAGSLAAAALEHGKHVVMVNAEADLAFGPYLTKLAKRRGAVYTSADGDQHTVIKRLADDLLLWGLEIELAGNIKGYLDRYATPASIVPEAEKRGLSVEMATALTDGTKLSVEMALVANALGLRPTVPGMQGPRAARVEEALTLFDLSETGPGIGGVVDYLLGAEPGGGVFVIARCDDPYQRDKLAYYKMGWS